MKRIGILALLLAACDEAPVEPAALTLVGGPQWVLTAIEYADMPTEALIRTDYRIGFMGIGKLWATLACNVEIYRPFTILDSAVSVSNLGPTAIQCLNDPYSGRIIRQFNDGPLTYRINGDTLRLTRGDTTLRFRAALTAIPWIGPNLDLQCRSDSTDLCMFDYAVDSSILSSADRTWLDARASDSHTKEIALVKIRDNTFHDSLLILNLTSGIMVAVHIYETKTGTFGESRWKGIIEGPSGIGDASFSVYPEGSTFGDFRFDNEIFVLGRIKPGIYLLTRIDTSVPQLPD